MTGDKYSGGPEGDDVRRLTALVEAQASRLAALEQRSGSTKQRSARRASWGRGLGLLAVVGGLAVAVSSSAAAAPNVALVSSGVLTACSGTKTTVKFLPAPVRILDTRDIGGPRGAGSVTTVPTSTTIPGAIGVIGNVTVTNGQAGYLTVWPGGTQPTASTINFQPGWNIANHVQSGLASDGTFKIYTAVSADIIFDATAGIYAVSKSLRLIDPAAMESCATDETMTTWNQVGPVGPAGPIGPAGPTGPPGLTGYHVVSQTFTAVKGLQTSGAASCVLGEKVLGGGASTPDTVNLDLRQSYPTEQRIIIRPFPFPPLLIPAGWHVTIGNYTNIFFGTDFTVTAYAVCANAS